jgi:hypothetical protein
MSKVSQTSIGTSSPLTMQFGGCAPAKLVGSTTNRSSAVSRRMEGTYCRHLRVTSSENSTHHLPPPFLSQLITVSATSLADLVAC